MLHDWLNRVQGWRERLQPRRAAEPEPYELTCICGEPLQGVRRENSQRHICRHCGEALLVFPLDVYPPPKPPRRRRRSSPGRRRPVVIAATGPATAPAAPAADDASAPAGEKAMPPSSAAAQGGRGTQRARHVVTERTERRRAFPWYALNPLRWPGLLLRILASALAAVLRWLARRCVAAGMRLAAGLRKQVTPLRLVFVAIALVVLLTVHFQSRRVARERAEIAFREAAEAGLESFSRGDFFTAAEQLQRALDALAVLDMDTPHAREVRIAAREAAAAARLLDGTLDEVIAAAERYRGRGRLDEWPDFFRVNFAGQWLVFETTIERIVDAEGKPHFRVPPYTTEQGVDVVLELDLPIFAVLWQAPDGSGVATEDVEGEETRLPGVNTPATPSGTKQVIFAAELSSCIRDESGTWHLRFNAGTACLWVHADAYRRLLGLPDADAAPAGGPDAEHKRLEAILRRQAVALGLQRVESPTP